MPVLPGAEPFRHDGGRVGALVLHGFTGSPAGVRPWGQYLADHGLTVRVPRLPGHGTTWQEMARTRWEDWYAETERAFDELAARCDTVVAMGLSMGGTLALRLAQVKGGGVAGIVLVNPFVLHPSPFMPLLPALRLVVPSLPGVVNDIKKPGQDEIGYSRAPLKPLYSVTQLWQLVLPALPQTTQPLLMFRSEVDNVLGPKGPQLVLDRIGSTDVEDHVLHDSYHVATLDNDAPEIYEGSLKFARRLSGTEG